MLGLLPKIDKVLYTTTTEADFTDPYGVKVSDRYGLEELMFIDALANEKIYEQYGLKSGDMVRLFPGSTPYLADSSCNILAWCTIPEKNITEITFSLKAEIDGARLNSEYRRIVDTVSENWGKNVFELSKEQYKSQDGKSTSVRLVKMNDSYVSDDWYCAIREYSPGIKRDFIGDAEYAMATVLFFSDNSLRRKDAKGNATYTNLYFTDESLYKTVDDPDAPASRGIVFKERSYFDRVIYFFTRDGVYLGRIYVPGG